jgi:hypothetical protein
VLVIRHVRIAIDTRVVRLVIVCVALIACGDDSSTAGDAGGDGPNLPASCNPLVQECPAGYKCTWLVDALDPTYVGHAGCAPDGTANIDEACKYGEPGATGFDNCRKGSVCSDYFGGTGICKAICDYQGGFPECNAQHTCVVYDGLFSTGDMTPAAGGLCDLACNPLTDNDFDGAGTASTRTTAACGSDPTIGCYGYPSFGTYPRTGWSCTADVSANVAQPTGLRHRVQCTTANGCLGPGSTVFVNSCNQGYLPLLRERTTVSTTICVALCKPKNCFAGNCGPMDRDRLGEAPHRCTNPDRVGTFDTTAGGEHCRFIWGFEIDTQGNFLRSPTSDTMGFCFDHSKYLYDSNNDNTPDAPLPACAALPDGFGGASPVDGAADLGCVDTTHAGLPAQGKPLPRSFDDLRPLTRRVVRSE